jgi:hypothetical protein
VRPFALTYMRIGLLGAALLVALAATGYVRGCSTPARPRDRGGREPVQPRLEVLLVYGFHLGIAGSAWGTVIAQYAAVTAYLVVVGRNVRRARVDSAEPGVRQGRRDRRPPSHGPHRVAARGVPRDDGDRFVHL